MRSEVLERWHRIVATQDVAALDSLLAEDAVFLSPAVHTPQVGRAAVARYLGAALVVLADPSFRYTAEWLGERSAVLEFELTLDGTYMNGVDIVRWNEADQIVYFKVMVRPWRGLERLIASMSARLQGGSPPSSP